MPLFSPKGNSLHYPSKSIDYYISFLYYYKVGALKQYKCTMYSSSVGRSLTWVLLGYKSRCGRVAFLPGGFGKNLFPCLSSPASSSHTHSLASGSLPLYPTLAASYLSDSSSVVTPLSLATAGKGFCF